MFLTIHASINVDLPLMMINAHMHPSSSLCLSSSLCQVRANYNNELEARTELELLLRRTVDEVQKEMDANK